MKIRKTIQIVAAVLSLALLVACSSLPTPVRAERKPLEDPYIAYAMQGVDICGQYLSFEITKSEAENLADDLYRRSESIQDQAKENGLNTLMIEIMMLHSDLSGYKVDDAKIKSRRDEIKSYYEPVPFDYNGEYTDELDAIGIPPAGVDYFYPVGYKPEYADHASTINSVAVAIGSFDPTALHDAIIGYLGVETAPLSIAARYCHRDAVQASFSPLGQYFIVYTADGRQVYIFGLDDAIADLYRGQEDVVEVIQCADPLTPDQAADFFLACLPE